MLTAIRIGLSGIALAISSAAFAGAQIYEFLADSVRAGLQRSISDRPAPRHAFANSVDAVDWLSAMAHRLEKRIPHLGTRLDLLRTVHYESLRAGLDPQLVLAIVNIESNFRKYAVSSAGARGYMQVMPFWVGLIGTKGDNLFDLRTNLRYGCVILRHYLDIEKGDLGQALARYNGSLGKLEYPSSVLRSMRANWRYEAGPRRTDATSTHTVAYSENAAAMVRWIDSAASRGSAALRIGRPTTI